MQSIVNMQEFKISLKTRNESFFVYQNFLWHLLYLDGIKDSAIRLNIKSKTQDNKNTFIQQKEAKRKASSRKQKTKNFSKISLESRNKNKNQKRSSFEIAFNKNRHFTIETSKKHFLQVCTQQGMKTQQKQMCSKGLSTMKGSKESFGSKDKNKRSKERFQESIKMTTLMKQRSNRS